IIELLQSQSSSPFSFTGPCNVSKKTSIVSDMGDHALLAEIAGTFSVGNFRNEYAALLSITFLLHAGIETLFHLVNGGEVVPLSCPHFENPNPLTFLPILLSVGSEPNEGLLLL